MSGGGRVPRSGAAAGARLAAALVGLATVSAAQDFWTSLGPTPIVPGSHTGRVAALALSTRDPNLYYVGGADGGVWRSRDGGARWQALGDRFPTAAIGALVLDPLNERVIYAGMGEANFANHSRYGLGVARSRDGGETWDFVGAATFGGRCISRIVIDRSDTTILYASVTGAGGFPEKSAARGHPGRDGQLGVFKSTDSGSTWQVLPGLPNLAATDLAIDPATPRTLYAAIGHIFGDTRNGIYKSTDAGASWTKLAGGLPATGIGRIALTVAPSMPSRLYAVLVRPSTASGGSASTLGIYRSDDAGATWTLRSSSNFQSTYGWYLCTITASPTDPDVVFAGGLSLIRSTNGGTSWSTVTPPHVDLHAVAFDAAGRVLAGDDGGVHRSTNLGSGWTAINANLGLVQLYAGISVRPNDPGVIYGGFQDNGSCFRGANNQWTSVLGGDGGYTGIDPTGTRVFVEFQGNGGLFRSTNGGSFQQVGSGITGRNCFLPPYEIHPQSPLLMIYGTERVLRSTDGGTSFTPISPDLTGGGTESAVRGLAFAPSDANTIYASTNDGRVQVTTNGGTNWRLSLTGVSGWARTTRPFAVHPTNPQRAYFAVGGFGVDQVLYTDDAGVSWTALDGGGLPDVPVHAIALDTTRGEPPVIYAGTDQGVWRSRDHGARWEVYGWGLPHSPVIDLRVEPSNARVLAATQGRGVWQVRLTGRNDGLPAPEAR
jgi:photosystem II stability/assembly factor-like uncharacterized protein